MDDKKKNIRLVRNSGYERADNYEERRNRSSARDETISGAPERTHKKISGAEFEQRVTYQKRQKQRRLQVKRRRTFLALVVLAVITLIVLFLTPIFNIRSVSVEGNSTVTAEQFNEKLKPLVGDNLLRTGSGKITRILKEIPYIDTVEVQKKIFPPSVQITVTEYTPAALIRAEGKTLVVNSSLNVLEDAGDRQWDVPNIVGVDISDYSGGKAILGNEDKSETLAAMLQTMESSGLIRDIVEIDINNLSYILINYDDRIEVKCGTQLDIERKIRLLKEVVTSNSLADNARGTVDLSETGKAVYTP